MYKRQGILNKRLFEGEVPQQPRRIQAGKIIEQIDQAKEGDLIIIGPGSFFTSILPHFLTEGLPQALKQAKGRGAKVIFIFGANYDNETTNLSVVELLHKLEEKAGLSLSDMFTHIILGKADYLEVITEEEILKAWKKEKTKSERIY